MTHGAHGAAADRVRDDDDVAVEPIGREEVPKQRRCLMCSEPFGSEWSGERLCKRCKASARWRGGS